MFFLLTFLALQLPILPTHSQGVSTQDWNNLNHTVQGRLHKAVPFEAPCFSSVNGVNTSQNTVQCSAIQRNYTNPIFRTNAFGAYIQSQWETCQSTGTGCLLDDTDPENPLAFDGKQCDIGNIPPYYIEVQSTSDIQAAFAFAGKAGVRLSVKSRGHDYKGRSSGQNTLSLWVGSLNSIMYNDSFVPEGCTEHYPTIIIGPGAEFQDIYAFADTKNVTFIGGYSQTIGSGFYLGGGHSVLSPNFGLGVDRLVQLKIVTSDGQFRTVNECQEPDLFWALRGGGGSAFGVVTELSLRVEPQMTLQAAVVQFSPNVSNQAPWYDLVVENSLQWGSEGWGGHIIGSGLIHVNPLLNKTEAQRSMKPAIDWAIAQGGSGFIDELPSWNSFFTKYALAAEVPAGPELTVGSRLISTSLFETQSGRDNLSSTIRSVLPFASPYIVVSTPLLFPYVEGSTSVTPAWRNSLWHLIINGQFYFNSTLEERQTQYAKVHEYTQAFRNITPGSGSYFNEGDVYETNYTQSYWGPNYARLLEIKNKYDPEHLLDCWQCVGWRGSDDPQYSCYIKL